MLKQPAPKGVPSYAIRKVTSGGESGKEGHGYDGAQENAVTY